VLIAAAGTTDCDEAGCADAECCALIASVTTGSTCEASNHVTLTLATCQTAATILGLPYASSTTQAIYPPGCFRIASNTYFNSGASNTDCSEDRFCICEGGSSVPLCDTHTCTGAGGQLIATAATTYCAAGGCADAECCVTCDTHTCVDNSKMLISAAATTTCNGACADAECCAPIVSVTTGSTCEASNHVSLTLATCQTASTILGLNYHSSTTQAVYPPGCFRFGTATNTYFNSGASNTDCSENIACICEGGSSVSTKCGDAPYACQTAGNQLIAAAATTDCAAGGCADAECCEATLCATNEHVNGANACVACTGGSTNVAGDDATGSATTCDTLTGCDLKKWQLQNSQGDAACSS